ncbi:hypothetical protein FRC11_012206, partial [Ceratobasidium sp. 423]
MSPAATTSPSPSTMSSYETLTAEEIKQLPDTVVWSWPDDIILAASQAKWRAPIYGHYIYILSVERRHDEQKIWYKFTCKSDPQRHKALYRWHKDDSSGTKKFIDAANWCNARLNVAQQPEESTEQVSQFSLARFQAFLALWCARNHRPFEMINDDLFAAIVNELRPGTLLPDSTTLSRDVQSLYQQNMQAIRHYFQ